MIYIYSINLNHAPSNFTWTNTNELEIDWNYEFINGTTLYPFLKLLAGNAYYPINVSPNNE